MAGEAPKGVADTGERDRPPPLAGMIVTRQILLDLICKNGGPKGLDLRGATLTSDDRQVFPYGQFEEFGSKHGDPATLAVIPCREAKRLVDEGGAVEAFGNPVTCASEEEKYWVSRPGIALNPEALAPLAEAYKSEHNEKPPWLGPGGGIDLHEARLDGLSAPFSDIRNGYFSWCSMRSVVMEHSDLRGASLSSADLREAHLYGTDLRGAELIGSHLQDAVLFDANLDGVELYAAELQHVDLYRVKGLRDVHWGSEVVLDRTKLRRSSLGPRTNDESWSHTLEHETQKNKAVKADYYVCAAEAYLLLKSNFNQLGRYADASWAYIKEQQMRKMANYWSWRQQGWRLWRKTILPYDEASMGTVERAYHPFLRWLQNWAYEISTGYGERPWNPALIAGAVLAAFALGFWLSGAVQGIGNALVYSLATFATLNLARSELNPPRSGVEIASAVEALTGIALLALLVFSLGNRMSRG